MKKFIDVHDLEERGWTETLIRKYLGEPDSWYSVNHYRNFKGKRIYSLDRVIETEVSDDFINAFLKSIKHRNLNKKELGQIKVARRDGQENLLKK